MAPRRLRKGVVVFFMDLMNLRHAIVQKKADFRI